MRLPSFEYLAPERLEDVLDLLDTHKEACRVLAGGTDLLVRMKQRLVSPAMLISLKHLQTLSYIRQEDDVVVIGAKTPLIDIIRSDLINRLYPGLVTALAAVGAPTLQQHTGTIGGNLLQENRCIFYNQSAFARSGRPACHKAGGRYCQATTGSDDRCRSTCRSDGAPMLTALSAEAVLKKKSGMRTLPLGEFFTGTGEHPHAVETDELLTELRLPPPPPGSRNAYQKLAWRSAVDFPLVSAAVSVTVEKGEIAGATVVLGAAAAMPLTVVAAGKALVGKSAADDAALRRAGEIAMDHAAAFMVDNVGVSVDYRIRTSGVMTRRALSEALAAVS